MTASGPFAMGPALAGNNARRSVPRSNFAPIMSPSKLGSSLAVPLPHTSVPSLKRETDLKANGKDKEMVQTLGDEEVYSDPDDGVEIVDMENVRQMDWMAPESLQKERHVRKIKIKHSPEGAGTSACHVLCYRVSAYFTTVTVDIDRGNALDLSDSEEEEELEDIMEHFAANADVETVRFRFSSVCLLDRYMTIYCRTPLGAKNDCTSSSFPLLSPILSRTLLLHPQRTIPPYRKIQPERFHLLKM